MNVVGRVRVDMKPVKQIMARLGIDARGDVQRFHTANVKRRIQKYMPYRTGATIKLMIAQSPVNEPFLHVNVPYARMLYYGKVMVDPGHPVRQDQEPQSRALLGPPPDRR